MFATWKALKTAVQYGVDYQTSLLKVATVIRGKHRIESIEAAVKASGLSPDALYDLACAGGPLPISFLEALYGPQKAVHHEQP